MSVVDHRNDTSTLGFWIYLMTDCVLFASLFAVYAVLHGNTFGGPGARELFDLPYVLVETLILLTSSFTSGLALYYAQLHKARVVMGLLGATALLGLSFLVLEISEFHHLITTGDSWTRSGFLSSYFTLVGTHGLHIAVGLIWLGVVVTRLSQHGLDERTTKRLGLFSLFWHFLDLIWIFIFSIVYLMGGILS